ncbi:MAG: CDP-diacylglycerol--serine O-phosphatidyltransferase [Sandaracinaceae bacterium]|nr:CDP-diacylglycerol--serine O-phosphatidyltransferase [Sandaracinaceae bacterium]MCC6873856.1 CDP-diacylglycerol--serine O-phosphatidyltransferase [Sandaracinaceae bacterium]
MRVNLRKTLFILPNLFTLSSIFCGFYAVLLCVREPMAESFYRASLLIVFAMFFDIMDGRVARLTRTQSAFGVQIDSLADVVSFGVAPAVLVYQWSLHALGTGGALVAFAFLACGAIRLARFNVLAMGVAGAPKKPSKYIVGLPIPGAAGILVSLVVANHTVAGELSGLHAVVASVVVALSFFMVSTVKFRSFKDLRLSWRTVAFVAVALGTSGAIALRFHASFALVWLLSSYVALALFETLWRVSRRGLRAGLRADEEDEEPREAR